VNDNNIKNPEKTTISKPLVKDNNIKNPEKTIAGTSKPHVNDNIKKNLGSKKFD
jgi:hypothetical protein